MKTKKCKRCKKDRVKVEYLGKNPEQGDKLFSVVCGSCGYDYIYSFNPTTKEYMRSGNLQNV